MRLYLFLSIIMAKFMIITMAPYSLSACQVVRVFCAVMRALGASPIMSLGIVFLTGYPTVKLLCNAMSFDSLL